MAATQPSASEIAFAAVKDDERNLGSDSDGRIDDAQIDNAVATVDGEGVGPSIPDDPENESLSDPQAQCGQLQSTSF